MNVKHWRVGKIALRWTAAGLLKAGKKLREVKGYRELELLQCKPNTLLTQQAQDALRRVLRGRYFQLNQCNFPRTISCRSSRAHCCQKLQSLLIFSRMRNAQDQYSTAASPFWAMS